jgi:amino acid transporter
MKKKTFRIAFIICIIVSIIGFVFGVFYSIYQIASGANISDNILFILCNLIGGIFAFFQIYSLVRSFKVEGHLINDLLYDKDKKFNKPFFIFINIFGCLIFVGLIYDILLFFITNLPLYSFPASLKILILSFFYLLLVNFVFIDLFPLTLQTKNEKFTLHR